jgi:hypothetical protein
MRKNAEALPRFQIRGGWIRPISAHASEELSDNLPHRQP